jgi:hypothetical protein
MNLKKKHIKQDDWLGACKNNCQIAMLEIPNFNLNIVQKQAG